MKEETFILAPGSRCFSPWSADLIVMSSCRDRISGKGTYVRVGQSPRCRWKAKIKCWRVGPGWDLALKLCPSTRPSLLPLNNVISYESINRWVHKLGQCLHDPLLIVPSEHVHQRPNFQHMKLWEAYNQTITPNKNVKSEGVAQLIECLPSMLEAPVSILQYMNPEWWLTPAIPAPRGGSRGTWRSMSTLETAHEPSFHSLTSRMHTSMILELWFPKTTSRNLILLLDDFYNAINYPRP